MPTRTDVFPSKWLKAADVDPAITVTIFECRYEVVGQGADAKTKPVLYFHGSTKPLVVNQTNWDLLVGLSGHEDSDNWPGTVIELYAVNVMGPNGQTRGIRIRRPSIRAQKKTAKPAPARLAPAPPSVDLGEPYEPPDDDFEDRA
jgi:hypothetical protein